MEVRLGQLLPQVLADRPVLLSPPPLLSLSHYVSPSSASLSSCLHAGGVVSRSRMFLGFARRRTGYLVIVNVDVPLAARRPRVWRVRDTLRVTRRNRAEGFSGVPSGRVVCCGDGGAYRECAQERFGNPVVWPTRVKRVTAARLCVCMRAAACVSPRNVVRFVPHAILFAARARLNSVVAASSAARVFKQRNTIFFLSLSPPALPPFLSGIKCLRVDRLYTRVFVITE